MKTLLIAAAFITPTFLTEPPEHGHPPEKHSDHTQPEHKSPDHNPPDHKAPTPEPKPAKPAATLPAPLPPPLPAASTLAAKDPAAARRADDALTQLREGNERWVAGTSNHPNTTSQRRAEVAQGQQPFAAILTCADSRLPAERLFDRGVGDLFVIRVAGNVAGDSETGTIEYGLEHLKAPLLVVMGHTKCGAVAAAASNGELHGKVAGLVAHIKPAVERAQRNNPRANPEDLARLAVKENVWQTIYDLLKESDVCRDKVAAGQVRIVGAICDITTGKVEWLGEHPWQSELLGALAAGSTKLDDH